MSTYPGEQEAQTTGRSVVVFGDDVRGNRELIVETLRSLAGITDVVLASDHREGALEPDAAAEAEAIAFDALGVAVVARDPSTLTASIAAQSVSGGAILAVEPERVMHAITVEDPAAAARFADDDAFTWGLRATAVDASSATGSGIRVAILDTGLDLEHPDFAGRAVMARSFVAGVTARDGRGHGTHCTGTACGSAAPRAGRRYGVASEAEIFAGKVLDDDGAGTDESILAGIEWAIGNGCRVISMSLSADIRTVSTTYETVGRRALAAGTLIVAAAGNNASRASGNLGFVGVPANSPSIMAVAAVDSDLGVADFSAAGNPVEGGQIDIAGPGVDVYSSWPLPRGNNTISGTSMATPHVAGIAALWSQRTDARGRALWDALRRSVRRLEPPPTDVGAGLVQAPD
jgi:subtilisin